MLFPVTMNHAVSRSPDEVIVWLKKNTLDHIFYQFHHLKKRRRKDVWEKNKRFLVLAQSLHLFILSTAYITAAGHIFLG